MDGEIKLHFRRIRQTYDFITGESTICWDMRTWYIPKFGKTVVLINGIYLIPSNKYPDNLVGKAMSYDYLPAIMENVKFCFKCGKEIHLTVTDNQQQKRRIVSKKRKKTIKQDIVESFNVSIDDRYKDKELSKRKEKINMFEVR